MPAGGRSSLRPGVRGKPRRGRVGPGRAHSLSLPGIDARSSLGHGSSRTIMGIALTHAGGVGEGERRTGSLPARSKVVGVWETGEGERVPPPRGPPPPVAISPRSSTWGDPGEDQSTVAHQLQPGHGCSPDIASTAPAPSWGRGRSAEGAGGVGVPRGGWVACRQEARVGWGPARSKMVGVWETGEGERVPPPREPPPPVAISPRSSARG